jgi:hypothetical protein
MPSPPSGQILARRHSPPSQRSGDGDQPRGDSTNHPVQGFAIEPRLYYQTLSRGLRQRRPQPRPPGCPAWRRSPGAVQTRLIRVMSGLAGRPTSPGANCLVEASAPTMPPTYPAAAYVGAHSRVQSSTPCHNRMHRHTRPMLHDWCEWASGTWSPLPRAFLTLAAARSASRLNGGPGKTPSRRGRGA